jgi:hypothetical protein
VYAQVYAFVLSDQVHMGAGDTIAPLLSDRASQPDDDRGRVLETATDLTNDIVDIVRGLPHRLTGGLPKSISRGIPLRTQDET